MASKPTVSIIIPTTDTTSVRYINCVKSIAEHCRPMPHEIITARFGGTFAENCNEGARQAKGDYLWLLNDDVTLEEVYHSVFAMRITKRPAITGFRLLYPNGLIQHAGVGFDQNGSPYNLWRNAPGEHPEAMKKRYPPAVTFASVLIPRAVWEELGGLDEKFVNAYEDVDCCLRAKEIGVPVVYRPEMWATHFEGQTPGRNDGVEASWRYWQEKWVATGRLWSALGVWPFSVERGQG